MKRKRFESDPCGAARTLDAVGEWWTLLILRDALSGIKQFKEFHRSLGISRNALTARLRRLVALSIMRKTPLSGGAERFTSLPSLDAISARSSPLFENGATDTCPPALTFAVMFDRWSRQLSPALRAMHGRVGPASTSAARCMSCAADKRDTGPPAQ